MLHNTCHYANLPEDWKAAVAKQAEEAVQFRAAVQQHKGKPAAKQAEEAKTGGPSSSSGGQEQEGQQPQQRLPKQLNMENYQGYLPQEPGLSWLLPSVA
eukprot:7203849-Lingulodinium_polyedra.AAC.1